MSLADRGAPELRDFASLAAARSWRTLDPEVSVPRLEALAAGAPSPLRDQAVLGLAWVDADLGRFDAAAARLTSAPTALQQSLQHPGWRRAGAAAALSAVVPGSGQLYAGAPREAAAAFVVVGGLALGTYELATHDAKTGAIVVGALGASFWLGNVYGAADAAVRHDRHRRDEATAAIAALEAPLSDVLPAPARY